MYKQFPSLAEAFLNYFDVDFAASGAQVEQVERVRYRVYCQEFGYEPSEDFPSLRERDHYDDYSLHCLVTHGRTRHPAGCVRLICASEDQSLPLEDFCRDSINLEYIEMLGGKREDICEFSRLAVDYSFRKRPGEEHTRLGEFGAIDCSHQEQRTFSLVGISAFLSAFALAELAGRSQIFAMMEPNLPRLLRRAGILVQQAGDTIEYHGFRAPYFITTEFALENMRDDLHILYEVIYKRLSLGYNTPSSVSFA